MPAKLTIDLLRDWGRANGGALLSTTYTGQKQMLEWRCGCKRVFQMSANDVQQGVWCPHCASGRGERLARAIFEHYTGRAFPNSRPEWLVGEKGRTLQLDGYCAELGVAFEHQGHQHYRYLERYHRTPAEFLRLKKRDSYKRTVCRKHGVHLIAIPAIPNKLGVAEAQQRIIRRLDELGVPVIRRTEPVDLSKAMSRDDGPILRELRGLAKSRGGEFLGDAYVGAHELHRWKCEVGHEFLAKPAYVRQGRWFGECRRKRRKPLAEVAARFAARGDELLSRRYSGRENLLRVRCGSCERTFRMSLSNYDQRGIGGCPECVRENSRGLREETRTRVVEAVARRGGKLVSSLDDVGPEKKVTIECSRGHQFSPALGNLLNRGTWCSTCARESNGRVMRVDPQVLVAIARERGGSVKLPDGPPMNTPTAWTCAREHTWSATLKQVRAGNWCPECAGDDEVRAALLRGIVKHRGGTVTSITKTRGITTVAYRCASGHASASKARELLSGAWCRRCEPLPHFARQKIAGKVKPRRPRARAKGG